MKFFLDNCLPPALAKGLNELVGPRGHEVVHLRQRFDEAAKDVDWIRQLGGETGWLILPGDQRILRHAVERAAWEESRLTGFFLDGKAMQHGFWKQVLELVRGWPMIEDQARRTPRGHGFLLRYQAKELEQVYPVVARKDRHR